MQRPLSLIIALLLLVLQIATHVDALRIASARLSNATAAAPTDLFVSVDFEGALVAADAVFSFALPSQLLPAATNIDKAQLATQLNGELHVSLAGDVVVVSRGPDAADTTLADNTLAFRLTHLTSPSVAGAVSLGSLSVGTAADATTYGAATLPSVWIAPGRVWNAQIAFANLLTGRETALQLTFTPSHAVPANGSVLVYLPRLYATATLQTLTLAGSTGIDGQLQMDVVDTALRFSWPTNASSVSVGGIDAMRTVTLQLDGLRHPLLEGPIGRAVRIETTDTDSSVIDQSELDVSAVLLTRATVQLSKRSLHLQQASGDQDWYAITLSAPPAVPSGITVVIAPHASDSVMGTASMGLAVVPSSVTFTTSNWTLSVNITVRALGSDEAALPASRYFVLSHEIAEAATEKTFAPIDAVVAFVEAKGLPLVQLSSRYVAVAEQLRNDSYNISLLARPSSDVIVVIEIDAAAAPFLSVVPSAVTFTSSSWAVSQTVRVAAAASISVDSSPASNAALRTRLTHHIISSDSSFGTVVPQSSVGVYYEPLAMVACVEPCRAGWFSAFNSSTHLSQCIACPLGSYCPGECAQPSPCPAGTHSTTAFATNQSVCVDCPTGSYANAAGRSGCSPCPPGAACPHKDASFQPCPVGTFALEGQGSCQPCPPGTYSSETFRERCNYCPSGSYCAGGAVLPTACANGTYVVGNGTKPCESCPAGYSCSNSNANPVKCPDGAYSLVGDDQCHLCPQGYYCPNPALTPSKCGQGTYSHAGAVSCILCPFGHKCTFPDLPRACAVGEISNATHSVCVACPAGYACPIAAATPVQCAAGSFSTGGAVECTPCAAGYACPDTTSAQRFPCVNGTYSIGGAASCTTCPAGYACPSNSNGTVFTPCAPGWYSPEGSAACLECPSGSFCDVPSELPKNCSVGSYSLPASTSCVPCAPGYECPRADQLPQPCPVGYYSGGAVANCRACRPGYKCGLASTSPTPPEDACPMGGYCNPPTTFFLCPAGTYGNVTAGESVDHACAPCPEGSYCEMGSTPLTRQSCPPGYVCPVGTKRASQFPCRAGTFNPLPSQFSLDVCQVCPKGSYCVQGAANPVVCPQGYYCPEGTLSSNQYPCPAGSYSGPRTGLTIASECKPCELGSYCPEASSTPTPCPAGTYNPSMSAAGVHECLDCPPGWSCPRVGQWEYVDRCATGHYCPSATVVATARPCPAGTYTDRIDLIRPEDCTFCPLRHACPEGTGGDTQPMLACGAGFFCPNGTAYATQFPCPPGFWSVSTSLAGATECDVCPVGKYCSGGKAFIDGPCSPGHYCPLGTPSPTKFPCPSGTFTPQTSLFEPSQCDDCPPGSYCPTGSVAPIPCKAGSFSSFNNTKSVGPGVAWPECVACPAGFYCTEASVLPAPCGKGRFSPKGAKSCAPCEAGYFCNSNTTSDSSMRTDVVSWLSPGALFGKCYNGTYCPSGTDHEPALEIDACPRGFFCPRATPAPIVCPAGTYSNLTGQDDLSDCIPTPAGFYSLEGALQPTGPCDPGFYCPLRSTARTQVPCPARYYLNRTGGQSEDDCAVCVAGGYCPRGAAYPVVCPTGAYCRTGVASPEPCPIGTYSNALGIKHMDDCLVCPPGMYCDATGLTLPRGPCDPGYFCTLGSYTSAPMSYGELTLLGVATRNIGGQCPRGSYCPLGSASPTPCPAGTSNNVTGLETERQCVPCPPGKYCETPGLVVPTGDCSPGYYCTGGASTPTQNVTPAGAFTISGSTAPVPCRAGQFNSHTTQEQCIDCPAGFYCGSPGTVYPVICPRGNYCPTSTALPIKCPPATYSAMEGLVAVSQCQHCPTGFFCDSFGLVQPSGPCLEGFVCSGGSPVSNPVAADYGYVCPVGFYCPAGSSAATQCPRGSFRATPGGTSLASCSSCPGGSYCGANAMTAPSGLCDPGFFCTQNASSATPSGNNASTVNASDGSGGPCPRGSFCPQGSSQPQLCPEGTYADEFRATVCTPCPAGYVCPLGSTGYESKPCPQGYYCPVGTRRDFQFPCPPGTYGNRTSLQDSAQCTPAPGGMYVDVSAAVKPIGLCKSGFYCSGGSATSTPSTASPTGGPCLPGTNCPEGSAVPIVCDAGFYCSSSNTDRALPCDAGFFCVQGSYTATPTGQNNSVGIIGDVCSRGHYCPQGTSNPIPCPPGTFSQNPQNRDATECFPCKPGFVCSGSGIVTPYEKCPAGFLCTGGEREATQQCPKGSECPLGSAVAKPCPPGTFSDVDGLAQCKLCPARYYCVAGSITPAPCPAGFFCPLQTPTATTYTCPPGSYSNTTLLAAATECAACPPGKFCSGAPPTDRPTGDCGPGHYCIGGASTATPSDGTTGDLCGGGFVCVGGAWLPNPVDNTTGRACPPGVYCPRGSSTPVRCAKGSYNPFEKQSACLACPAGGYCDTNATTPAPCPMRSYCPQATSEPVLCPPGTYGHAPSLASAEQCAPCTSGKFCVGGELTASCAAGYYCKLHNAAPNPPLNATTTDFGGPCPVGHYCPEGVVDPLPCPNATARLTSFATQLDDCGPCPAGMSCANGARTVPCPAGHYCPYAQSTVACPPGTYNPLEGQAKLSDCRPCRAGKLCNSSAIVELTEIYDCPTGHYCLEASTVPMACPQGRFRRTPGATRVDECVRCPGGSYCGVASVEPIVCASQTYCPIGSGSPLPCPGGAYCSSNSSIPVQCPMGFHCALQVALPTACDRGFYCPIGSVAPLACPLGFIGRETPLQGMRSRLQDACEPCPAGTFGADPNRTRCDVCLEGYVCLEATRSSHPQTKDQDNGYMCPPGFYCPAGSSKELPCPSGTYQPNQLATNATDCKPCPTNSYQSLPGQANCLPCSKSAYASGVGATVCTCKGSHRAFQMTDGYCICEPGFEFYDQDMVLRSDEDDDVDCQPIVYDRCGAGQVRADGGACVAASQTSCEKSCGNNTTGTLVASLGICQCDKQVEVDAVCDKTCRDAALRVRVDAATGELQLYDPATGKVESLADRSSSLGIVSKVSCAGDASSCQLHTIALTSGGFSGSYDVPASVGDSTSLRQRRRLTASATTPSTIENPMVCLHVGEGIFFDLSSPDAYPVYLKDSMLNTNPTFDYGAFRALASRVKGNTSMVSVAAFAFSFTDPGIYVFGSSLNGAAKTVITVMQAGTACPTEAPILPLNEKNLIAVSVKRRTDDMILAPDWGLIIGLLGGLVGMVVAVIASLYYFRTKSWATSSTRRRLLGYRAASKATDLATMHSKGVAVAANKALASEAPQIATLTPAPVMVLDDGKPSASASSLSPRWPKGHSGGFEPDLARWEEEDLDLRELVDRLQQHHDAVAKCFDDQKGDVKSLLEHLQGEAGELKRLLVQALASAASSSQEQASPHAATSVAALRTTSVVAPRVPEPKPIVFEPATASSGVQPAPENAPTIPPLQLTPHQTSVPGAIHKTQGAKSESVAPPASSNLAAAVMEAPEVGGREALRQAGSEVDAQEHARHEHLAMIQKTFPELSVDDRQRLLDEFGNDLGRLESALNVEAHKTREDIRTLRTARAVMTDRHERAMQAASQQQTQALEQDQQRRLTLLESKFAQEENEIEQEYQRELQRLEQEFAALDEGGSDEAFPMSERKADEEALAFDGMEEEGDAAAPSGFKENAGGEDGDDEETDTEAIEMGRLRTELVAGTRDQVARDAHLRRRSLEDRLDELELKSLEAQGLVNANPELVKVVASAVDTAIEKHLAGIRSQHSVDSQKVREQLRCDGELRREKLRERLARKRAAAGTLRAQSGSSSTSSTAELQAEEVAGLQAIDADVESGLIALDASDAVRDQTLVECAESEAVDQMNELERLLASCRSQYERDAAVLGERLARERRAREQSLQERLAARRAQRLTAMATATSSGAAEEEASEADLLLSERMERAASNAQLAQKEGASLEALQTMYNQQIHDIAKRACDQAAQRRATAVSEKKQAEAERQRLLDEYAQERQALLSAQDGERMLQQQRLRDALSQRRQQKLGATSEQDSEAEDELAMVALLAAMDARQARAARDERKRHAEAEAAASRAVGEATGKLAASEACVLAIDVARDVELRRLALEVDKAFDGAHEYDGGKRSQIQRITTTFNAKPNSHERLDTRAAVAAVMDSAMDDELERMRRQYDASRQRRVAELDAEAAVRRASLHDRMELKRKALVMRAAAMATSDPTHDAIHAEQAALLEAEAAAEAAIAAELASRKREPDEKGDRQQLVARITMQSAAQSISDDLEKLVEACRAAHDKESAVLKISLDQERQRRELGLQDRLAKRRAERLAEAEAASVGKPVDDQRGVRDALEQELVTLERQEREQLEQSLAQVEAQQLADTEAALQREVTQKLAQADRAARERQVQVREAHAATEDELRRVRDDHARQLAVLWASLDAERKRQEQKLQEKLATRRAERRAQGVSDEVLAVDEASEVAELRDELQQRASRAVEEERTRHEQIEQGLEMELVKLSVQSAAADAASRAIEATRQVEMERISAEFDVSLRRSQVDVAVDALATKTKLQDRLAQRRRREKGKKMEPRRDAAASDHEEGEGQAPDPIDSKTIAKAAMEDAVEDEVARIKREFAETLTLRLSQIDQDATAKKAILRDRIEQKRRALAMRAVSPRDEDSPKEEHRLQDEAAAAEAAIDEERSKKQRAAVEESESQQRAAHEVLELATTATSDELERLLEACQQAHATNADALRRALDQERRLKEQSLRDRLARRREQALADAMKQFTGSPEDQAAVHAAVEKELQVEEEREEAQLAQSLADEDTRRFLEAEAAQRRQATDMLEAMEKQAQDRAENARAVQAAAEAELRRVQDDHARERAALEVSLDAERKRQEQKLQEKLATRRAERRAQGVSDEVLAVDEASEVAELRDELQQRASRAVEEERTRHEQIEQGLEMELVKLSVQSAAADAASRAIEATRQVEMERISAEFDVSLRRSQVDVAVDALATKTKLQDRLAQRRRREKGKKMEPRRDAAASDHEEGEGQAPDPIDSKTIAKAAMEDAVEDEVARIKREFAETLTLRLSQIDQDATAKKAILRDRIEQKRRALAMRAVSPRDEDSPKEEHRLQDEAAAAEAAIDEERSKKQRAAVEESESQQRAAHEVLELATTATSDELERLLEACQQAHATNADALRRALDQERRLKEQSLRDRLARRREQALADAMKQFTGSPEDQAAVHAAVEKELQVEEEREEAQLAQSLADEDTRRFLEAEAAQRRQATDMLEAMEKQAQDRAENARAVQAAAEAELRRVQDDHARERAALEASLSVERKQQEKRLQEKLAARRAQRQAAHPGVLDEQVMTAEDELERLQLQDQLRLDEERERQRQQEAELVARVAQAEIDARVAEAARLAMDAARTIELERLASEFDATSRELRQSHLNDLHTQTQKLEARVAAKKQKKQIKLMELEAKRAFELQKLRERQEQEARDAETEQQRVEEAVEVALEMATGGQHGEEGDGSAPPLLDEEEMDGTTSPEAAVVSAREETTEEEEEEENENETARAVQQARDIAAIQQLLDAQVVPERMTLLAAVELVLSQRHANEMSHLLARQSNRKSRAMRMVLREILQQKTAAKAAAMLALAGQHEEQRLRDLDVEYDTRIRTAEEATIKAHETQAAVEGQRLQNQQLSELRFLLHYFAAADERRGQQQQQQVTSVSPPRQLLVLGGSDASDDLLNDLRARLQLDADARIQQLLLDKHNELERLQTDLDSQLRRLADDHARFVEQERAAMEAAFLERVRGLALDSTQRAVLERETSDQLASLLLMLRGRLAQHEARVKRLATSAVATVEHAYARKIQIVTATMHQRIVAEQELLRNKAKAVATPTTAREEERKTEEEAVAESGGEREAGPKGEGVTSDLRRVIELRLGRIEGLLHEQLTARASVESTKDPSELKQSLTQAVDDACRWRELVLDGELAAEKQLRVVAREAMDVTTQTHVDFANALVRMMMLMDDEDAVLVDRVVVAAALPPPPTPPQHDGVLLTHFDPTTRTLFVRTECFAQLSVGQWALLLVHGVAEATTHTRDVADPRFLRCVYKLLAQCYQNLFLSQPTTTMPEDEVIPQEKTPPANSIVSTRGENQRRDLKPSQQWQSRVVEMERFLSGFQTPRDDALRRSTLSQSGRLLLSSSSSSGDMEAQAAHGRRQFLREKLDSTEKLYAHVLRQHQEQKQSLDYVREMLELETDASAASSPQAEAKSVQQERLDALHHEAQTLEHAVSQTRRERDDLFAQCQALRDELQQKHATQAPDNKGGVH